MGFLAERLLEGTKNKCYDNYLIEIVRRYRSALRAGFSESPNLILNIHNEIAQRFFEELGLFLRNRNIPQTVIDEHYLDAEVKALATACERLNLDFDSVLGLITDSAHDLAAQKFNRKLSYLDNFAQIRNEKELKNMSVLWRWNVLTALKYIEEENTKKAPMPNSPIIERINQAKVAKPGTSRPGNAKKPIEEIIDQDKVKKPGTSKPITRKQNIAKGGASANGPKNELQSQNERLPRKPEMAHQLSIPLGGWTWYCEHHDTFGLVDDYDECLFMFGAHMSYHEIDSESCEPHFTEWTKKITK